MTSLAAWIGVDRNGQSSGYIVSDSRISWGTSGNWDMGKKVFVAKMSPELIGYCGDVPFATQIISRAIELIDSQMLFSCSDDPNDKQSALGGMIRKSFQTYPRLQKRAFRILYCTREGQSNASRFHFWSFSWDPNVGWEEKPLKCPSESGIVECYGTGMKPVLSNVGKWDKSELGRTSRGIFSAFCDSLNQEEDPYSGGPPQLGRLYRSGNGSTVGTIFQGKRFHDGFEVDSGMNLHAIEWRNELFERCDGVTMLPLPKAQRHARPTDLVKRKA